MLIDKTKVINAPCDRLLMVRAFITTTLNVPLYVSVSDWIRARKCIAGRVRVIEG